MVHVIAIRRAGVAAKSWQPFAKDMLTLLNGAEIDSLNFNLTVTATNSDLLPNMGMILSTDFWKEVSKSP